MTLRFKNDDGSTWHLGLGKYRVFSNAKPTLSESIEVLTPGSVASTAYLSYPVRVKVESPDPYRILLSESSKDNVVELKRNPSLLSPISKKSFEVVSSGMCIQFLGSCQNSGRRPPLLTPKDFMSLIDCLKKLQIHPRGKSKFKLINFASMHFEKVKCLPTSFNGNVMFELLPLLPSISTPMQCQMVGMNKKFNGHM
jgi:hypothetical protein